MDMTKAQGQQLRAMRDAANLSERSALERGLSHDESAQSMIRAALNRSIAANKFDDVDPRLILLPSGTPAAPKASVASVHTVGAEAGLPENSLYIETLGSTVPGGGTAVLKSLADQYPDFPIFLNSLEDPATLQFYKKRGFIPQDPLDYPELPSHLPLFVLPEGRKLNYADGGTVKKVSGGLRQLYELLNDTMKPKDAATAFSRGLRVSGTAPAWFEQHRPELIAKALKDPDNLIVGLPKKEDIDHALQLMSGSRAEDLAAWSANGDGERAAALTGLRPWDGGQMLQAPYVLARPVDEKLLSIGGEHDGRHRLLSAALSDEGSALQLLPATDRSLSDYRGSMVRVESPFDFDSRDFGGEEGPPFSYLFRNTYADGGKVADQTKYRGTPDPGVHLKEGKPVDVRSAFENLKRGFKNWVPDAAGFFSMADPIDWGSDAVRWMAKKYLEQHPLAEQHGVMGDIAGQESTGLGDKVRALVGGSDLVAENMDRASQVQRQNPGPLNFGEIARFSNPAFWMSPAKLAQKANTETGQKMIGALAAMHGVPLDASMAGIIKPKGGNWLNGVVENQLANLKTPQPTRAWNPDEAQSPINTWIDKQLTRYVKNDLGTEGDPLRALAEEQGISLVPLQPTNYALSNTLRKKREVSGMPPNLLAKTPLGRQWEQMADAAITPYETPYKISNLSKSSRSRNPWLDKLEPGTPVYGTSSSDALVLNTNFSHLIDELSNAINPNSGLPRELQLRPESLSRVSVPDAVKRVHEIGKWREAKQAEANAGLANNTATHLVREYPHTPEMPNPKGLRWVELRYPSALPDGYTVKNEGQHGFRVYSPEGREVSRGSQPSEQAAIDAILKDPEGPLADALKYEGDTMGHCVGGYCDDVASGRSRIFSLRDAKGEPHVTIEVGAPERHIDMQDDEFGWDAFLEQHPNAGKLPYEDQVKAWADWSGMSADDVLQAGQPAPRIIQIKGKANRKPNDEYLPFVQDFVRNPPHGQPWSDVGDLVHTDLIDLARQPKRMEAIGKRFVTDKELTDYLDTLPDLGPEKFASGGMVRTSRQLGDMIRQLSAEA